MTRKSITVIGAGTMGHSIALNFAWKGFAVTMSGQSEADLERGLSGIRQKLALMVAEKLIASGEDKTILEQITPSLHFQSSAAQAHLVIEAAPEVLELKHEIFKELEMICSKETIFASNTSGLTPSRISEGMINPERFLVMHFWNPAHLIPLVEVVPSPFTSPETITTSFQLLHALDKKPVLVKKEIPGFISNRVQFALLREALYLLENEVASAEDIDAAVTYSIGRRLPVTGPFASADLGGLDLFAGISDYLFPELSNARESSAALRSLVSAGKYGSKTGEGFYKWEKKMTDLSSKREQMLIKLLRMDGEV